MASLAMRGQTVSSYMFSMAVAGQAKSSEAEAATSEADSWAENASGVDSWMGEASRVQCAAQTLRMANLAVDSDVAAGPALANLQDGPHCRTQDLGGVAGSRSNSSHLTYT